ncbi:MAG TPA: hypothetical protein VFM03_04700 [Candidatus Limnocylindria bacterium]|nr:hypothetical protein [Candidatus Limnocylindria bacterium]
MSRRVAAGAAAGLSAGAAWLLAPSTVSAHALGGTFQLPVPLWLYLAGAAIAVAASFVVTAVLARERSERSGYPTRPVPEGVATVMRLVLRAVGLAWWYGAVAVGFLVGDISPLPAVLLWIGIWVGLPIAAVLLGNPWPSMSPFRTTYAALEWIARRLGARGLDLGLPYPRGVARWPAFALLAIGIWIELILPGREVALTVALLLSAYTLLTLTGMVAFGQIAWLRNAELFEVELAWFGRVGPIGRRSVSGELCEGCDEGCDASRCIDCPECSTAADDAERVPVLRPWVAGLTDVTRAGWSDAAFIVLALAGVSFDGLQETGFGAWLLDVLLPPVQGVMGTTATTFLLVDTLAFASVFVAFFAAFALVVAVTHRIGEHGRSSIGATAGVYAATLLPIAGGYLIAHYLTLVLQGAVWLPELLADPLNSLAPELSWIPMSGVWYLSVGSIVIGHVAAIVLAHRLTLRDAAAHAVRAGLPMVALMVGYTILSLWIIAQPIVVEPGGGGAGAGFLP